MKLHLAPLAAAAVLSGAALAQEPAGFEDLQGRWSGAGMFQGMPSTVRAEFGPTLGGAFWRLDYAVEATSEDGAVSFAGEGIYPAALTEGAEGLWIDVRGAALPTSPRFEDGALVVAWTEGETQGRSTYALDGDTLSISDAVMSDGEARVFAEALLHRTPSPEEVVEALYAAFNAYDLDAMWALYAEDSVHVSPTEPEGWSGEAKFRDVYGGLFDELPGLRDDVKSVTVNGERAAVEFVASWDGPEGRIELPIAGFLTIRDGKIVEDVVYYDN